MKDRVPLYPGRVRLTPVSGQENTYDMVRADEPTQEGTPLSKKTLLQDETAALFGLGSDAVPNDVFGEITKFGNWYVWGKNIKSYSYNQTEYTGQDSNIYMMNHSTATTVRVSETLDDALNGVYTEQSFLPTNTYQGNVFNGKYIRTNAINDPCQSLEYQNIFYIKEDAVWSGWIGSNGIYPRGCVKYADIKENLSSVGYVLTPTNTAPVEDGYTFVSIGQFGEKSRIATGSYVGTGTYGSSNPNILTFDFEPKLVFITDEGNDNSFIVCKNNTYASIYTSFSYMGQKLTWEGNTLKWYCIGGSQDGGPLADSAVGQLNGNNKKYYYIAIG